MQKWTTHIGTLSNRTRLPTSPPLSSSVPSGPAMEPHISDRIINDVFNWLFDYSTPFLVMWIHDKTVSQTILVAQVIAGILDKLHKLSASFFSGIDGVVNVRHVIPTLAYQLGLSRPEVQKHVGRAVANDGSIFNLEIETQLKKLLCDPILAASESEIIKTQGIPNVFVIHGLENYHEGHFQSPFLQDFVDTLLSLRAREIPHRLLIIGQPTSFLQSCISKPNIRQIVLQRPITASFWFGKEAEISSWHEEAQRREEDLGRREEGLRRKEEELRVLGGEMENEREELESELEKIKKQKEELKSQSNELRRKEEELRVLGGEMESELEKIKKQKEELKSQSNELRRKVEELKRKGEKLESEKRDWNQKGKEVELEKKDEEIKRRRHDLRLDEEEAELSRRKNEMSKRENEMSKRENEMSKREEEVRRKDRDPGPNQRQDSVASTSTLSIEAPQLTTRTKSLKEKFQWLSPRSEGRHSTPVSPANVHSNFIPTESEPPDLLVLPLRGINPRKLAGDTCRTLDALKPFCNEAGMYVLILSCYLHLSVWIYRVCGPIGQFVTPPVN